MRFPVSFSVWRRDRGNYAPEGRLARGGLFGVSMGLTEANIGPQGRRPTGAAMFPWLRKSQ